MEGNDFKLEYKPLMEQYLTILRKHMLNSLEFGLNNMQNDGENISLFDQTRDVFEIHDYIIVRKKVPENIDQSGVQVLLKGNKVKIIWADTKSEIVELSANIDRDSARAIIKEGILEVRLHRDEGIKRLDIQLL